jgi:hypothetical protein
MNIFIQWPSTLIAVYRTRKCPSARHVIVCTFLTSSSSAFRNVETNNKLYSTARPMITDLTTMRDPKSSTTATFSRLRNQAKTAIFAISYFKPLREPMLKTQKLQEGCRLCFVHPIARLKYVIIRVRTKDWLNYAALMCTWMRLMASITPNNCVIELIFLCSRRAFPSWSNKRGQFAAYFKDNGEGPCLQKII